LYITDLNFPAVLWANRHSPSLAPHLNTYNSIEQEGLCVDKPSLSEGLGELLFRPQR